MQAGRNHCLWLVAFVSLIPVVVQGILGAGRDVVASPVILEISETLGVRLSLGVGGVVAEPGPKVCSGH